MSHQSRAQQPRPGDRPPPRPRSGAPDDVGFTRQNRVRWLAPGILRPTAVKAGLSGLFGRFADRRELQRAEAANPIDLSEPDEFWFDYVSDVGDGFDATTTVASLLAADHLELDGRSAPAGALLVMGGDQVYPTPSPENYNDRLVGPYRAMLPWTRQPRWLVVLPGNHDWYDGLVSFLRQFCQGRWIGGWRTAQARSYFAVKLPGGWWLWGVDTQLGGDIDKPQLDYFAGIANQMEPEDAVVLCWAKPVWAAAQDDPKASETFEFFLRTVLPDRAMLRVALAGDAHHYAHYAGPDGRHLITSGGGGAYLSATHHLPDELTLPPVGARALEETERVGYQLADRSYPSRPRSRRLRRGIVGAIYRNRWFGLVPAAMYLLIGMVLIRAVPWLLQSPRWLPGNVFALLFAGLLVLGVERGLVVFTDLPSTRWKLREALGLGHTVVHLALVVASVVGPQLLALGLGWGASEATVLMLVACFLAGGLVGPGVMAGYLLWADRFGVNTNELFSAQAIEGYKCFLRLHIGPDAALSIFPVRVDAAVPWRFDPARPGEDPEAAGSRRWFEPAEPVAYGLIEPPTRVGKRPGGGQPRTVETSR